MSICVYDENNKIVARVKPNNNLDYWDGRNFTNGSVGQHSGLTMLKNKQYVYIRTTQWINEKDYAVIISEEEALQKILASGNNHLFELEKFASLKQASQKLLQEDDD